MLKDIDVARYFLCKDVDNHMFTKAIVTRNGRTFYEGNARLNKYLHLAQNIYIAKTGTPLMEAEFYAYDNGAVSTRVVENYPVLLRQKKCDFDIPADIRTYLDKFYTAFESADLEELIDLSHEDKEWIENSRYYLKEDQKMDSMKYKEVYKEQYKDIIKVLDRMQ
jgi:uncharacterized phage-associated protein